MSKKYELRKIKTKRSYTFKEIAELLDVHVRTVQAWHIDGLNPLEGSNNPYLVMGKDLKMYLKLQTEKHKVTLGLNEFYCMSCRKAVIPEKVYKYTGGIKIGGNKPSVRLSGICPTCSRKVNKFTSNDQSVVAEKSNTIWALETPREDLLS